MEAAAGEAAAAAAVNPRADAIVDTYRRILVLMSDEASLAKDDRPRAFLAGKLLFEQNRHRLAELEEEGSAALEAAQKDKFRRDPPPVAALLDRLEQEQGWHDADKLPFRDPLRSWAEALR